MPERPVAAPGSSPARSTAAEVALCRLDASIASPSDAPRARLKEIVAAGNWPMRLMTSGAGASVTRASADNGICCVERSGVGNAVPGGRAAVARRSAR